MRRFSLLILSLVLLSGCFWGRLNPPDESKLNQLAEFYFVKKDYEKCIAAAKQALALNPNQWRAHEWIDESTRLLEARDGRTLALFYTGNTQGVFVASSDQPLGGFPRRAGLLSALRERFPYSVTVDAGNGLSPRNAGLKRGLLFPLLKRTGYDACNLGEGEWALGADSLSLRAGAAGVTLVSTNAEVPAPDDGESKGGLVKLQQVEAGKKFLVSILGILPPPAGRGVPVDDEIDAVKPVLKRVAIKSDLVVLLAAASLEQCRRYAAALPGIDVIICGGSDSLTYQPDTVGGALIVSPGARGEYLGQLLIHFTPTRRKTGSENRLIPLDETVPEDANLSAGLKEFIVSPKSPATDPAGAPAPRLPLLCESDPTLRTRARLRVPGLLDSLARSHLPLSLAQDTSALDSAKAALSDQQSAFIETLAVTIEQRIALEKGDTTRQVYLKNLSSGELSRVSWNFRRNRAPVFNAGRSALFYFADTVRKGAVESDLFVYRLASQVNDRLSAGRGRTVSAAGWAADGRSVYYILRDSTTLGELFIKRPLKNVVYNLSRTPGLSEEEVAASPDGRNIVFTRRDSLGTSLYLAGSAGEHPVVVAAGEGDYFSPAFSGGGRYLAVLFNKKGRGEGYGDLILMDLSTGRLDTLVRNSRVREFLFNGDNEIILVSGINYTDLNALDVQSGAMRKLIQRPAGKLVSERRPRLFQGKNGRLVLYFEVEENGLRSPAAADYVTGETVLTPLEGGLFELE